MEEILQDENLRILYVNCISWMKHYLYDRYARFDVFSTFESQLLLFHYLSTCKPLDQSSLPSTFLSFLAFLATTLSTTEPLLLTHNQYLSDEHL
jgi:hypothetical protein